MFTWAVKDKRIRLYPVVVFKSTITGIFYLYFLYFFDLLIIIFLLWCFEKYSKEKTFLYVNVK